MTPRQTSLRKTRRGHFLEVNPGPWLSWALALPLLRQEEAFRLRRGFGVFCGDAEGLQSGLGALLPPRSTVSARAPRLGPGRVDSNPGRPDDPLILPLSVLAVPVCLP